MFSSTRSAKIRERAIHSTTRAKIYQSFNLPSQVIVGDLRLNCQTFNLQINDRLIILTPAEFDLLYYFMAHAGRIFSAEDLLCDVWQYQPSEGKRSLVRAHIKNLRAKIEPDPQRPTRLITVGRLGYALTKNSILDF